MSESHAPPAPPRRRSRARLALAIGPDRLIVLELRGTLSGVRPARAITRRLAKPAEDGSWPDLAAALAEAQQELGVTTARVDVALLPPLAQAKVLSLPPVRVRELVPLVLRNARRYFVSPSQGPFVGDVRRLAHRRSGTRSPVLAVCAPESLLRSLTGAISASGLQLVSVSPASLALARAVLTHLPRRDRADLAIAVCAPGWRELLLSRGGQPRAILPLPPIPGGDPMGLVRETLAALRTTAGAGLDAQRLVMCCATDLGDAWAALTDGPDGSDLPELLDPPGIAHAAPELLAALGAALLGGASPTLRLGEQVRLARRRALARAGALAGATFLLLAGASGAHFWELRQELELVRAHRSEIAPAVAEVRGVREQIQMVRSTLETIGHLEETAPRWTAEVAAVAAALPADAYLQSLSAQGSQLRLGGLAKSASDVVPSLESSSRFSGVTLAAPVRREAGAEHESFDLTLTLSAVVSDSLPGRPGGAPL